MTEVSTASATVSGSMASTPALARKRRLELLRSNRSSAHGNANNSLVSASTISTSIEEPGTLSNINSITNDEAVTNNNSVADAMVMGENSSSSPKRRKTNRNITGTEKEKNSLTNGGKAKNKPTKPKRKVKTNIRYDPDVPMSKEETAAWRREARRVRNRESAAASRQKTKSRIEELEVEVQKWRDKFKEAESMLLQRKPVNSEINPESNNTSNSNKNNNDPCLDPSGTTSQGGVPHIDQKSFSVTNIGQPNQDSQGQGQKLPDTLPEHEQRSSQQLQRNEDDLGHGQPYLTPNGVQYVSPCNSPNPSGLELKTTNAPRQNEIDPTNIPVSRRDSKGNIDAQIETSFAPASLPLPSLLSSSTHDFQSLEAQAEVEVEKLKNGNAHENSPTKESIKDDCDNRNNEQHFNSISTPANV